MSDSHRPACPVREHHSCLPRAHLKSLPNSTDRGHHWSGEWGGLRQDGLRSLNTGPTTLSAYDLGKPLAWPEGPR